MVAAGLALVHGLVGSGAWLLGRSAGPVVGRFLAPTLAVVAAVATLPLSVAVYVPARAPPANLATTLRRAGGALREHTVGLFRALLPAQVVAVGVGLAVIAAVYVVATGVRLARYAVADPAPPYPAESALVTIVALSLGLVVGQLLVRFFDVAVVFDDVHPDAGWRASLGLVAAHPRTVAGYAVLLGFCSMATTAAVRAAASLGVAATVLAYLLVGGAALAFALSVHVALADRLLDGADARPRSVPWSRVAVVAIVLVAAVGGAAGVRTADVRPGDRGSAALPSDPEAAASVAARNTVESSHRRAVFSLNNSAEGAEWQPMVTSGVDYEDRQLYVYFHDGEHRVGSYFAEGTLALYRTGHRGRFGHLTREHGNWTAIAVPGYSFQGRSFRSGTVASFDGPWTVVAANASTVVVRLDDSEAIRAALAPESYAGMGGNMTDDSYLRVVVDRERGVLERVRFRLASADTGRDFSYRVEFRAVGRADLERPAAIGDRRPVEWLWDALYY